MVSVRGSHKITLFTLPLYTHMYALGSFCSSGFLYGIFSDVFGFNYLSSHFLLFPALPFPTQFNSSCSIAMFSPSCHLHSIPISLKPPPWLQLKHIYTSKDSERISSHETEYAARLCESELPHSETLYLAPHIHLWISSFPFFTAA